MKRLYFIIFILLPVVQLSAQPSDLLQLQKRGKPVQRFYAGSQIAFQADNGAYRDAVITAIRNDSIYLREYLVQRIPTTLGFFITDTVGSYRYVYHYRQIKYLGPAKKKNFNMGGSGASLFGGGILLTVGSLVTLLADKEKFSPGLLAGGAGLGAFGYFLLKTSGRPIEPGRHGYSLQYINLQP